MEKTTDEPVPAYHGTGIRDGDVVRLTKDPSPTTPPYHGDRGVWPEGPKEEDSLPERFPPFDFGGEG